MNEDFNIEEALFGDAKGDLTKQRNALDQAFGVSPDQHSQVLSLSQKTGLDTDVIERNKQAVEKSVGYSDVDLQSIFDQTPEAKEWAADPDNMKLVSDDLSFFGRVKETLGSIDDRFSAGMTDTQISGLGAKWIDGQASPQEIILARELYKKNQDIVQNTGTGGFISEGALALSQSIPSVVQSIAEGQKGGVASGLAVGGTALVAGLPLNAAPGVGTAANLTSATGLGVAAYGVGTTTFAIKDQINQQRGSFFVQLMSEPDENGTYLDEDTARAAANLYGMVAGPLDTFGLGKTLKAIPGGEKLLGNLTRQGIRDLLKSSGMRAALKRAGVDLAEAVVSEGSTEALQQIAQDIAANYVKEEANLRGGEFEKATGGEILSNAGRAFAIGAVASSGIALPGAATQVAIARKKYTRPEDIAAQAQALHQEVRSMPLMQRSPDRAHRLFQDIAGDEKYYIDPDIAGEVIYALPEQQRQALFSAVPNLEVELANSQTTGADIPIKKADYAAFIAPYQQSDALVEHLKLDPADMSLSERKTYIEFMAQNPEAAQILKQSLNEQPQITTIEAQKSIERTVRKALVDAGRSNTEARVLAPLFARTFSRQAAAVGADPLTFFNNSLQFQTVDENGNVVQSSGNVENILSDIDRVRSGKTGSMDAGTRQAVEEFSQRLDALGVSTDQARSMGAKALIDLVYPKDQTQNGQRLDQNPIDQLDLPLDVKEVAQDIADGIDALNGETEQVDNGQVIRDNYLSPDTETIHVDGVERSTKNSEGNLIADTPEKIRAFWRWFGDSKVVDADGKPLVVYHGTAGKIDWSDRLRPRVERIEAFERRSGERGLGFLGATRVVNSPSFFFTPDYQTASSFAYSKKENGSNKESFVEEVYLSIQNPFDITKKTPAVKLALKAAGYTEEVISAVGRENLWEFLDDDRFVDYLMSQGYDGAITNEIVAAKIAGVKNSKDVVSYAVFKPTQIKSIHNRGTFDPNDQRILYQSAVSDENLMVVHNLSAKNLVNANKVGGLAIPSLAVTRTDIPFDSFGDITLIAPPSLADPQADKANKVFDADVYSPRYPRVIYESNSKKINTFIDLVSKLNGDIKFSDIDRIKEDVSEKGIDGLLDNRAVKYAYLSEKGEAPEVVYREKKQTIVDTSPAFKKFVGRDSWSLKDDPEFLAEVKNHADKMIKEDKRFERVYYEDGELNRNIVRSYAATVQNYTDTPEVDTYETGKALDKLPSDDADYKAWVESKTDGVVTAEKIFNGFTPSGNRRYLPHNLDNVVKLMKGSIQGAEGFNYGVPSIRAVLAKKFKSLKDIKKDSDRLITSEQMDAVKEEIGKDFDNLWDRFSQKLQGEYKFGDLDNFSTILADVAKTGRFSELKSFYKDVSQDDVDAVNLFLQKLKNLPTQYFEVKVQRPVNINEFVGAIVADNTPKDALKILDDNNIPYITYKRSNDGDRAKVTDIFIRELNQKQKVLFQKNNSIGMQDARGWIDFENGLKKVVITFTNRADFSTGMHEFSHFATATHRMFAQIARERIAAGDTSSEAQRVVDDWEKLKNKVGATSDTFTVEQEEQVASMFELYMREGNAPSDELRNVFSRYRDWLLAIYSDMRRFMGIDLDDETRSVFDNWLASQDEIDKIKDKNTSMTLTAKALGLDENIIEKISSYLNSALYVAEEKLFKDFRKEQKKKETLEYKQKYDAAFKASKEELLQKRQYRMVNDLDENGIKIYVGNQAADRLGLPDTAAYDDYENSVPASQEDIEMMSREGDDFEARKQAVINVLLARQPKEPKGLFAFLRSKGGIKDESGELKRRDLTKQYPGLVNNKSGMALDQALLAAREAGYFQKNDGPNPDTLSINDLLDAIDQEASGMKRYADADMQQANEYHDFMRAFDQADQYANEMGIDIEKERLKRKKFGRYGYLVTTDENSQGATHSDIVAENFGYRSGEEMLAELKATKDLDLEAGRMANDRMQKEYPELRKNRKLSEVAINALQNDKTLLALDTMINEIGKATGQNRVNMRQFAKVLAQQQLMTMRLDETGYAFRWDAARDKEMRNALQYARNKAPQLAMLSLQKAMVNHMLFKQLNQFNQEKEKAYDLFKRVNAKDKTLAPSSDIDFVGAARGILHKFGMAREGFDIAQWLDDVNERDPSIRQDLIGMVNMVRVQPKPAKDLTVAEFIDIRDAVTNIMWVARSLKKIEREGKEIEREKIIMQLTQQLDGLPQSRRKTLTQTSGDKMRSWAMSFKSSTRRVEQWVNAIDGGFGGLTRTHIWDPIATAENNYRDEKPKWVKMLNDILAANKDHIEQRGKIDAPELSSDMFGGVFRDRLELIGWLRHTGNKSNMEKLLDGYGINRANWDAFLTRAYNQQIITDKDMKVVQDLWNFAERLKPMSQRAHKKLYGYRFDEIEPMPITTPFGTYPGGYWPAIVDYSLVEDGDIRQAQDQANGIGNSYMIPATGKGFTMKRVDGYRRPLSVDLRLATSHVDKVLRFSILEPAVRDVSRIVNNKDYREVLQRVDEFAGRNMLNPWLQRVARQETEKQGKGWEYWRGWGFIRQSASAQTMMFNLMNAIQNYSSIPTIIYKVGAVNFVAANARYARNPIAFNNDVRSLSTEMRVRQNIEDIDITNAINDIILRRGKFLKAKNWAKKHGYIFHRLFNHHIETVAWAAAFEQHTAAGHGEADAIKYADSIVRTVIGSTAAKDASDVEASTPFGKTFLMFYSWFNGITNLIGTDATNIIRRAGWKGAPELFYMYLMTAAIPFFVGELIVKAVKDDLPEDEDDDGLIDDYLAWFGMSQVRGMTAMVPGVGPVANSWINRHNDFPMDDRITLSPVVSLTDTTVRYLDKTLFDDGYNDNSRMVRDALTAIGFMTGLPLGQFGKPVGYIADVQEGDAKPDNVLDFGKGLIVGPSPKK